MNNYDKAQKAYDKAREGINVKENEQIVLKCKIGHWCYLFARDIKGADIKAHEQVVLENKELDYSCAFAYSIPGANLEEHFKLIYNSGDKEWFNKFIEEVNYKDTKIEEWLMYIKSTMNAFEKAQIAYWEAYKSINVKENEKIVLESKTSWCYDFARYIPGADIKAHEQVILELKDPKNCFYFAKIPGANIEEHFKVIVNSGSKYWLDAFIKYVDYKNTKVEEWLLYI